MRGQRISITDIARECSMSKATVSRVLNGRSGVQPETRAHVLAVLKARGYRPRVGRVTHDTLGVWWPAGRHLAGFYYSALLDALAQAAALRGSPLTLLPASLAGDLPIDFDALLRQQRLLGLLFIGGVDEAILMAAHQQQAPHSVIDHPQATCPGIGVMTDIAGGIAQAVAHLVRLGHRRITLLNGPDSAGRDGLRAAGLRQAFDQAGLPWSAESIVTLENTVADRRPSAAHISAAIDQLWSRPAAPTALISAGEWLTIPALLTLQRRGLRLPRDLSFVAFHDTPSAQYFDPPLTTIRQPIDELARRAVELLVSQARGSFRAPARQTLHMDLIIRESTGLAPERPE